MYTPTPFLFFSSLRKAIPREQEIWNYNSAGDKWYVALLWIINESRRALVLPSCLSVIQTVWREQDTLAKQVEIYTLIHTHEHCVCHRFQYFRSSGSFTVLGGFSLSEFGPWSSNDHHCSCDLIRWTRISVVWIHDLIILRCLHVTQQQLIHWLHCDVIDFFAACPSGGPVTFLSWTQVSGGATAY